MSEKVTKSKALCYVVRGGMLLVHRHVDFPWEEVGVQVPAGSIRQGEAPEAAALREAREETGLQDFKIVRKLGATTYDMGPYRAEIQEQGHCMFEIGPVRRSCDVMSCLVLGMVVPRNAVQARRR
ncbi:NUDIX domain-containing protein [Streptomyces sp. NRRL F-4474]|uniref:NUDIX domain-containing protein n=1 Tax=Streptomyces sp. NRRL F-4474 TaxID=1463851 RepID=UPI00099CC8D3|nr:NUDIX hydrolase [Streptomyces sp. NRRL F-4474]